MSSKATITYEQPLNDPLRICLRLERLFNIVNNHVANSDHHSSRHVLFAILEILNVIDRPDLKSKLTQTLTQLASTLGQLEQFPQVDQDRLRDVLATLDRLIVWLQQAEGKIGEKLRSNGFLNHVRLHLGHPGGVCDFTTPALALWLHYSPEERQDLLKNWRSEFVILESIVEVILKLSREGSSSQHITVSKGFYQKNLDPNLPSCQLVRLVLPLENRVYPEISIGKHRLVLRLLQPDYVLGRGGQIEVDIVAQLILCRC